MNDNVHSPTRKVTVRFFWPYLRDEKVPMLLAGGGIIVNSVLNLMAPILIGRALDTYILAGDMEGVWRVAVQLAVIFVVAFVAGYVQTIAMGGVGQRLLYKLRNVIFAKLNSLPVAFFHAHKAGDLISRMNNDTDRLNQFFSQAIMQFTGNAFMMIGAMISLLAIDVRLGAAALLPALLLLLMTQLTAGWVKRKNAESLQATGALSASVQENLENMKVIIAFNRRDYFRSRLALVNDANYRAAFGAGMANAVFTPVYSLMGNAAQLVAITYGVMLIAGGSMTLGILVSVLAYITRFYDPLRHIASFSAAWQSALAAAERIEQILVLTSSMELVQTADASVPDAPLMRLHNVTFTYPSGNTVLHNVNLCFETGKIYALVGPTGGGKTTTASLMARLFDPSEGTIELFGKDIRSYTNEERVAHIGFILQDPFLFTGTVRENIVYANAKYTLLDEQALASRLTVMGLDPLLARFDKGLATSITTAGGLSAGQQQIIAFMRAVLREPKLLILDEATANIDTVTERLLQNALDALPQETTRVIIAHRLNTIENADEIFFVNSGTVTPAGSLQHAIDMLLHKERSS